MSNSTLDQHSKDSHGPARSWLQRIGDRVFAEEDAYARAHGWRITERRGGLCREYRSPFFDRFSRCGACQGSGLAPDRPERCGHCSGTGRIDSLAPVRVG